MKAAVVPEHGRLELMDIAPPQPGPYDCLVKIDACATCTGTDSNIISGHFPFLTETPFVLGHESTGLITEVGEKVRNFKVGQRVSRPAGVKLGQRRDGIGSNWGGFAELGLVHDDQAAAADGVEEGGPSPHSRIPLPDDVDVISAALSINHREILSSTLKLGLDEASRLVVVGSGYNGLLFSFFGKYFGAGRTVMVGNPARAQVASSSFDADAFVDYRDEGAASKARDLSGGDPTHVVDAIGSIQSMTLAKALLGPKTGFGRYGVHDFHEVLPMVEEIHKSHPELDVKTDEVGATDRWHELWQEGIFKRDGMCDGTVPLDDIVETFARLARREAIKFVVTM